MLKISLLATALAVAVGAMPHGFVEAPALEPEEAAVVETVEATRYSGIGVEEEDIELLAALVWQEARGEPYDGQVAVAEVVLNRCISDSFPDTISGVIYQQGQFSPAEYLASTEPTETQYQAVYDALDETEYILTEETVYFSTSPYNDSISAVIGAHYFCEIGG